MSRTIERPEILVQVTEERQGIIDGVGQVVLKVKDGRIALTPDEADTLAGHLVATAKDARQPRPSRTLGD